MRRDVYTLNCRIHSKYEKFTYTNTSTKPLYLSSHKKQMRIIFISYKIKMSSKIVDASTEWSKYSEKIFWIRKQELCSASRLATCEFHLWISYSTDNEHTKCNISFSFLLQFVAERSQEPTRCACVRIQYIAFSARSVVCISSSKIIQFYFIHFFSASPF